MLEEKSIYLVFEYAEHDFLVRPSTRSHLAPRRLADSVPPAANHPPPLVDSHPAPARRPQVAPVAALQRRQLPARQLDHPPRPQAGQHPRQREGPGQDWRPRPRKAVSRASPESVHERQGACSLSCSRSSARKLDSLTLSHPSCRSSSRCGTARPSSSSALDTTRLRSTCGRWAASTASCSACDPCSRARRPRWSSARRRAACRSSATSSRGCSRCSGLSKVRPAGPLDVESRRSHADELVLSLAAKQWPGVVQLPEWANLSRLDRCVLTLSNCSLILKPEDCALFVRKSP